VGNPKSQFPNPKQIPNSNFQKNQVSKSKCINAKIWNFSFGIIDEFVKSPTTRHCEERSDEAIL
jgi:hypothetical protein